MPYFASIHIVTHVVVADGLLTLAWYTNPTTCVAPPPPLLGNRVRHLDRQTAWHSGDRQFPTYA